MAKTTARKNTARPKRDRMLEETARAKRRLRALEQANRDISRLADRITRAHKASRLRLLDLAHAIAAEQGLELRPTHPIARTREELDQHEKDVQRAFDGDNVADGARARA